MTGNISKEKRDKLLSKIADIKEFMQNNNADPSFLGYLNELQNEISSKKYGLVYEEHREEIDEILDNNIPFLTEDKDLFIKNKGPQNFLIEGDNLASLKILEKTHKDNIDFIYIDPPYNTGNKDFIYDDNFVDESDSFRHSKWLSFMKKRLEIARRLLSSNGVIFISIDYNEDSQLKLLMNEIFREENFISKITREAIKGGSKSKFIRNTVDYVLVYAKNINNIEFSGYIKEAEILNQIDEKGPYLKGRELNKWGAGSRKEDAPSMFFPIPGPDGKDIYPIRNDGSEGRWRLGKKKMLEKVSAGDVIFEKRNNGTYIVYEKIRETHQKIKQFTTLFLNDYTNSKGGEAIKKLFGTMMSVFDYAKPVELIYDLLVMGIIKENATILDFFAGSGTTGHAVMKYNEDFNKNLNYILCTDNQNNICKDITYQRIKKAIEKNEYQANLKYMRVNYLPVSNKVYYEYADELINHITELVELENAIDFKNNKTIDIALTDEKLDEILSNEKTLNDIKKIYLGHDILMSQEQAMILNKNNIEYVIIPNYYYSEK